MGVCDCNGEDMWRKSEYLKNLNKSMMKIHLYTALVLLTVPTYILLFADINWNDKTEVFVYCMFVWIPVLMLKKWLHWIKQILKGVEKKYVIRSIGVFSIYWILAVLSIYTYGNTDNSVMYVLTVLWCVYSFVLFGIRWCIFSSIMEKYCPYIVCELRRASLQKNNMEVERILDDLMESTGNPEVKKAVQVRKAIYPIWIFQIYVLVVSLTITGPVYTVFSSL